MKEMKAAVFYSNSLTQFYVETLTVEIPSIGANEVLVRVKAAGICGSDLHDGVLQETVQKGKNGGHIKGHEFAGDIVQTGTAVKDFHLGDRIVVDPIIPCGECFFCKRGSYNICPNRKVLGKSDGLLQGGYAEYAPAFESRIYHLPQNISYEQACLLDGLAVALHSIERAGSLLNKSVSILGSSTIGLFVVQLAKMAGASKIFVTDVYDYPLKMAKELGADVCINVRKENFAEKILDLTGGLGSDIVFECVGGDSSAFSEALPMVRRKGIVVLIGRYHPVIVPVDEIVAKGLNIRGSQAHLFNFPDAIELAGKGKVRLADMITHRFPLNQIGKAFSTAKDKSTGSIKVIIVP